MNFSKYLTHPIFNIISNIADNESLQTFVVGGFVRDLFLQRPSKDIDVVVVGNGIDFAEKVAEKIGKNTNINVFRNFGTAMLQYKNLEVEFVGARKESYQRNSRKPVVENGTLQDDQLRRDFTINALALSLNSETFGNLLDSFNGLQDLENQIIRTPTNPDTTFSDDPLRMIRAIRFSTQLNFTIHQESLESISRNKERTLILSKERIVDEFHKIILSPIPSRGFKLLDETGLLPFCFPELAKLKGIDVKNEKSHKDIFYHSLKVLDNISRNTNHLWLRWAALLHDIGKPATKQYSDSEGFTFHAHEVVGSKMIPEIFKNLRMPLNEKMKYVQKLVFLHLRPIVLSQEEVTDSAIRRLLFEAGDDIDDLMLLCEADITSGIDEKVKKFLANFQIVRQKLKEVEEKDAIRNFQPPISGELIMEIFGLSPCKIVGDIKNSIKDAILDGKISNNYFESFNFMLKEAEKLNIFPVKKI